jgi:chitin synthase
VFYIGYLIWWFATDELASIPMVSLLMIAAVYGFQLVIIILQQEWQHIGWFFVVSDLRYSLF